MRGSSMFLSVMSAALCIAQIGLGSAQDGKTTVQGALRELAPSANLRIIGGTAAALDAWSWQVFIAIPTKSEGKEGIGQCGGSLIASQWVLTAAHCFRQLDRSRVIVVLERGTGAPVGSFTDVDKNAIHRVREPVIENYNPNTSENDIALLHLSEPARSKPVRMLLSSNQQLENPPKVTTVTGWGRLRDDVKLRQEQDGTVSYEDAKGEKIPDEKVQARQLMEVEIPLIATGECKTRWSQDRGVGLIDDRILCAGVPEDTKDACHGDSGGPMVVSTDNGSWIQIGLVSWGADCGGAITRPGVYTRVSKFEPFLRRVIGRDLEVTNDQVASQQPAKPAAPASETRPGPELDNPAGVAINFDKGDVVNVGDRVSYRVTTRRPGYLTILDATPDGKLVQVFPNARSMASPTGASPEAARLLPERPLLVPNYGNPYRGFDIRVEEPRGKGMMVAILSDKPIGALGTPQTPKTFNTQEGLAAIEAVRSGLLRDAPAGAGGRPKPNWSVSVHEYTVR